jgi:hypothetical protein
MSFNAVHARIHFSLMLTEAHVSISRANAIPVYKSNSFFIVCDELLVCNEEGFRGISRRPHQICNPSPGDSPNQSEGCSAMEPFTDSLFVVSL